MQLQTTDRVCAGAPGKTGGKRNKKRRLEAEAAALAHGTALPAGSERERELARQTAGLKLLTSLLRVSSKICKSMHCPNGPLKGPAPVRVRQDAVVLSLQT